MSESQGPVDALLADVENYLGITWQDDATARKLRGIIAGGMAFLDLKIGTACDYAAPGLPRSLLMDYCRYARDDALDVFENNYLALIVAAQHERMVRDAQAAEQAGQQDQSEL